MLTLALNQNNCTTAEIRFSSARLGRLCRLNPAVVDITPRFAPERKKVEDFIRSAYSNAYNARIAVAYPTLMSVRHADGSLMAAAGFRFATDEPLFLEQYTDAPVEAVLSGIDGTDVAREQVCEIGNLVSAENGASLFLYTALSSYLHSMKASYAVFTGTEHLHRQLTRLGIKLQKVCDADSGALRPRNNENWGRYYETRPRVLSGCIADSVSILREKLGAEYKECAPRFFSRLHYGCNNE